MFNDNDFPQFVMTEDEKKLFETILENNHHLGVSHYVGIYVLVKLASRISEIDGVPTKDDLKFLAEYRLQANSLKINPKSAQVKDTDFAVALQSIKDE